MVPTFKDKNGFGIRPMNDADIGLLYANLKEEDMYELQMVSTISKHPHAFYTLQHAKDIGEMYTVHDKEDHPVAILGLYPDTPKRATICFLCTTDFAKYGFQFMKHAIRLHPKLFEGYDIIHNWAYARNKLHLKFMDVFGFKILAETTDMNGRPWVHCVRTFENNSLRKRNKDAKKKNKTAS